MSKQCKVSFRIDDDKMEILQALAEIDSEVSGQNITVAEEIRMAIKDYTISRSGNLLNAKIKERKEKLDARLRDLKIVPE